MQRSERTDTQSKARPTKTKKIFLKMYKFINITYILNDVAKKEQYPTITSH